MVAALVAAVLTLAVLTVLPGPDVAVVTRVALGQGRSAALRAALGIVCGLLLWGCLAVAGVAAVLAASDRAYLVVKVVGAVLLVGLGVQALWHARETAPAPATAPGTGRPGRPWRTGLATNLLNPKIGVFYTSLLPQLVPRGAPETLTLVGLVLAHAVLSVVWLSAYVVVVTRAASFLGRPRVRRALDRLTGVVLVGLGARVLTQA